MFASNGSSIDSESPLPRSLKEANPLDVMWSPSQWKEDLPAFSIPLMRYHTNVPEEMDDLECLYKE